MKIGAVTPTELRAVCEKGLLLVTITIPEMEVNCVCSLSINCFGNDFTRFLGSIISFSSKFAD